MRRGSHEKRRDASRTAAQRSTCTKEGSYDMKRKRLTWLGVGAALAATAALLVPMIAGSGRWDLIDVDFAAGSVAAGGVASARANDNSKITLHGSGTFHANSGKSQDVSGGGTWQTFSPGGAPTASGTYEVTGFVDFELAPGTPPLPIDLIGNLADARAGLAVLRIAYSDGSDGTLVISCHLVGTPDTVFEGITATKGFVDYWNPEAPPAPPGNENRTLFHVV
jgi:hypothetical protein